MYSLFKFLILIVFIKNTMAAPSIIYDTELELKICNRSNKELALQYINGYGVTVDNIVANRDLQYKIKPFALKENTCINPSKINATSFNPNKGSRLNTPGSITFNFLSENNIAYSFALSSIKSGIVHFNSITNGITYKYAYLTNLAPGPNFDIYVKYYDEMYDPQENFVLNKLEDVINQGDGGYMQNLGGKGSDFEFYICNKGIKCIQI